MDWALTGFRSSRVPAMLVKELDDVYVVSTHVIVVVATSLARTAILNVVVWPCLTIGGFAAYAMVCTESAHLSRRQINQPCIF
jgi:hypothetical protein